MVQYTFIPEKEVSQDVKTLVELLLEEEVKVFDGVGTLRITRQELAEKIGKSERTVTRLMNKAESEGVLTSEFKRGRGGGLVIYLKEENGFSFPVVENPVTEPSVLHDVTKALGFSMSPLGDLEDGEKLMGTSIEEPKPQTKKNARRTKAEMRKARNELLLQNKIESNYNRKLMKRPAYVPLTWDFFKTTFGNDAEDVYGAYLVSRLYDAYFEATTNYMREHVEGFKNNFGGNYRSLPFHGEWFGNPNFIQFLEIFREAKQLADEASPWALIATMFDTYTRRAVFKQSASGKGYAPYPKNLRLIGCIDNLLEVVERINSSYAKAGKDFRVTMDTFRLETYGSMACIATGQALEEYIAEVTGLEEPAYYKYLHLAGEEIKEKFLSMEPLDYMDLAMTRLDFTLRNYYFFVDENVNDMDNLTADEKKAVTDYVQEWIFLKKFGIDSDFNLLASPALEEVHDTLRYETMRITNDDRLSSYQKEQQIISLFNRVLPEDENNKVSNRKKKLINTLWDYYTDGTIRVNHYLHEIAVSKRQRSGYEAINMDALKSALPKVKHLLALDRYGVPEWEYIATALVDPYVDPDNMLEDVPYTYEEMIGTHSA